jgi:hypothetical protein
MQLPPNGSVRVNWVRLLLAASVAIAALWWGSAAMIVRGRYAEPLAMHSVVGVALTLLPWWTALVVVLARRRR